MLDDILVVDDDPDIVDVIQLVLRGAGYATRSAMNGRQALDAVAVEKPAVVLLDMRMPVMDGWECARELRARWGAAVPIVVVTAAEHAQARGVEIGADAVLAKPFDVDDLLRVVARLAIVPANGHPARERDRAAHDREAAERDSASLASSPAAASGMIPSRT